MFMFIQIADNGLIRLQTVRQIEMKTSGIALYFECFWGHIITTHDVTADVILCNQSRLSYATNGVFKRLEKKIVQTKAVYI